MDTDSKMETKEEISALMSIETSSAASTIKAESDQTLRKRPCARANRATISEQTIRDIPCDCDECIGRKFIKGDESSDAEESQTDSKRQSNEIVKVERKSLRVAAPKARDRFSFPSDGDIQDTDDDYVNEESESQSQSEPVSEDDDEHLADSAAQLATSGESARVLVLRWNCPIDGCSEQVFDKRKLQTHLLKSHKMKRFRCLAAECGASFDDLAGYNHHRIHGHKRFGCSKCKLSYPNYQKLYRHHYAKHDGSRFGCSKCDFVSNHSRGTLEVHVLKHRPPAHKCTVKGCDKTFHWIQKLRRHLASHTRKGLVFRCSICKERFRTNGELCEHKCPDIVYRCTWPNCGHTSQRTKAIGAHIRRRHFLLPVNIETQKKLGIVDDRDWRQWMESVASDGVSNSSPKSTPESQLKHYDRPHKCTVDGCGSSFYERHTLRKHMAAHARKGLLFHCAICKESFCLNQELSAHKCPDIVYRCTWPDCGRTTQHSKGVRSHIRRKHFHLPVNVVEQQELGIVDDRDWRQWMESVVSDDLTTIQKPASFHSDGTLVEMKRKQIPVSIINLSSDESQPEMTKASNRTKSQKRKKHISMSDDSSEDTSASESESEDENPRRRNRKHNQIKQQIKVVSLDCHLCQATVDDKNELDIHLIEMHKVNPFRCLHKNCGASFGASYLLGQHLRRKHARVRQWPCANCGKTFCHHKSLATHHFTFHAKGRFRCAYPDCTVTDNYRSIVYDHARIHEGPFECEQCDKVFLSLNGLIAHRPVHDAVKRLMCTWPGCTYKTSLMKSMRPHIKNVHFKHGCKKRNPDAKKIFGQDVNRYIARIDELNGNGQSRPNSSTMQADSSDETEIDDTYQNAESQQQESKNSNFAFESRTESVDAPRRSSRIAPVSISTDRRYRCSWPECTFAEKTHSRVASHISEAHFHLDATKHKDAVKILIPHLKQYIAKIV